MACARSFKAVLPAATSKPVQELTVVTYNMLADKYAMSGHHKYCPTEHLEWSSRSPRLLDEITSYKADILCLQEVERPFMEDELGPKLRSLGHKWLYYGKLRKATDPVPGPEDGVCLSYNASRLEILASMKIRFGDYATKTLFSSSRGSSPQRSTLSTPSDTPVSKFLDSVKDKEDGAIVALLRDTQANQLLIAASTHLYWDPRHPDIKAAQATLLCAAIREFLETQSTRSFIHTSNVVNQEQNQDQPQKAAAAELVVTKKLKRHDATTVPILIGGDFNSLPVKRYSDAFDKVPAGGELVSGVYELLTKGQIKPEHQDHPASRRKGKTRGGNSSGGSSRSDQLQDIELNSKGFVFTSAAKEAWGSEPMFTNRTPGFTGCLDYIFFTSNSSQVSEILKMPFGNTNSSCAGSGKVEEEEEAEVMRNFPPIPNAVWPSDHLAVGAKLRWKL
ncbi:hypothetical protein Ndes2526B_g03664 [Nannochloris sp. 'desiccata']|nr:hypothetical protein KSW81_005468 [Chlorella desiccata (nom. nud.)]KAH7621325.1 putative CCR4-Not complex 3'-5'-exoribonuclease subunit Ccr4 [Chlorella desiccata (nom. nud.)]